MALRFSNLIRNNVIIANNRHNNIKTMIPESFRPVHSFSTASTAGPGKMTAEKKEGVVNKTALANVVAETFELKKSQSKKIVDTILDTIMESVAKGGKVRLSGFGSLETYTSKATSRTNPQTGKPFSVPEKKRIRFQGYTDFKGLVEKGVPAK